MSGQIRTSLIDVNDTAFRANLTAALARMKVDGTQGLQNKAIEITNRAKELCPVGETGFLRSSIFFSQVQHDAHGAFVTVGASMNYAAYVEFGTYKMSAQPYFRPALAEASGSAFSTRLGAFQPTVI